MDAPFEYTEVKLTYRWSRSSKTTAGIAQICWPFSQEASRPKFYGSQKTRHTPVSRNRERFSRPKRIQVGTSDAPQHTTILDKSVRVRIPLRNVPEVTQVALKRAHHVIAIACCQKSILIPLYQ